jgi:hypothetical protein
MTVSCKGFMSGYISDSVDAGRSRPKHVRTIAELIFLFTATTVVSAFGVITVPPFNIGLAAESFKGIRDVGSLAMLDAACTK